MRRFRVEVYREDSDSTDWRWRMRAPNGRIVADGAEGYKRKSRLLFMLAKLRLGFRDMTVETVED